MALEKKLFLDFPGLATYDELIKKYIQSKAVDSTDAALEELAKLADRVTEDEGRIAANEDAIEILNGDASVEGSVDQKVDTAIKALIDSAPEALDTLKEIADWIAEDETGTAALIERVTKNEDDIAALEEKHDAEVADLKAYVDTQDQYFWNHIGSIEELRIQSLFAVEQGEDESVAVAIAGLEEGAALKLAANQTVAENINITKDCYIDANGATFTGTVTVPAGANVVIENATFSNPVVVA